VNRLRLSVLGIAIAFLGILAVVVANRLPIALAGGAIAVASAGGVAALWMAPRILRPNRPIAPPVVDSLGSLRGSLSAGSLGRERVVFAIQSLEFGSGLRVGSSWSPDQVRSLLSMPPGKFREWFESHLDALERET
jgi:hypothetical protein